jgi:hypothetical protein
MKLARRSASFLVMSVGRSVITGRSARRLCTDYLSQRKAPIHPKSAHRSSDFPRLNPSSKTRRPTFPQPRPLPLLIKPFTASFTASFPHLFTHL